MTGASAIAQISVNPLLRLSGVYRYHSPMLKATFRVGRTHEIHGGTAIDSLLHFTWRGRGVRAIRQILIFFLEGLLDIAGSVEAGKIPADALIEGTSYFFNDRTVERLGFLFSPASVRRRLNLAVHFVDLTILASFSQGSLSVPRIQRVRKACIPAWRLSENRALIADILGRLDPEGSRGKPGHVNTGLPTSLPFRASQAMWAPRPGRNENEGKWCR